MAQFYASELLVINEDLAICGIIEPLNQLNNGALTGAGCANDRCGLARLKCPRKVFENALVRSARVVEVDIFEANLTLQVVRGRVRIVDVDHWFAVNHIKCTSGGSLSGLERRDVRPDASESKYTKQDTEKDGDDVACRVGPIMRMVPEALIDPDGTQKEGIRVSKIHAADK